MTGAQQVATIVPNHKSTFKVSHRKENHYLGSFLVIDKDRKVVIDARSYGTSAQNYYCIWVWGKDNRRGSGSAGGYGYHRPSAAAQQAITSAGYKLSKSIDGVGTSAIQESLLAIAKTEGFKDCIIIEAHA